MKNIHVIPTDKPSRLYSYKSTDLYLHSEIIDANVSNSDCNNQHIYITSDEEIKEGDWALNIEENTIFKPSNDEIYDIKNSEAKYYEFIKKIVIATDHDLIKDGVQAIDDEFLEWFVKNPSCEEVEVEDYNSYGVDNWKYLITIPVEELKQESLVEKMIPLQLKYNLDMMKQETLEQAAEKYAKQFDYAEDSSPNIDFIEGAKWQQERSYSEEEVFNLLMEFSSRDRNSSSGTPHSIAKWFEQFKKK